MAFDNLMTSTTKLDKAMAAAYGLAACAVLAWGITPAITAIQVSEIPALQAGLMRSVFAVPPAILCIYFMRLAAPKDAATWGWLMLAGFAAFCGFPHSVHIRNCQNINSACRIDLGMYAGCFRWPRLAARSPHAASRLVHGGRSGTYR